MYFLMVWRVGENVTGRAWEEGGRWSWVLGGEGALKQRTNDENRRKRRERVYEMGADCWNVT